MAFIALRFLLSFNYCFASGIPEAVSAVSETLKVGIETLKDETHDTRMIMLGRNEEVSKSLAEKVKEAEYETDIMAEESIKDYAMMRCYSDIRSYVGQLEDKELLRELLIISQNKNAEYFNKKNRCNNITLLDS